ncbi:hypothetical protein Y032_0104g3605 [Ancylostoma ceylanicum]|uniref:Uncharacterized protein n=1 Tax=Ancylostoma ceylanicum TaxID=53326 RepID=A0A016TFP5_9BILA|nr:hypothetical protein Y032_0104g3605 [Ancylostoma ceylanicum]
MAEMALSIMKMSSCFVASFAQTAIVEIVTKDESADPLRQALWCPTFQVGTQCPENTLISYYKCCGHLHNECCSHLRVWVLVLIIALPVLLILPPLIYILHRILCKRRQRYSAGIQMTSRETRESRAAAK